MIAGDEFHIHAVNSDLPRLIGWSGESVESLMLLDDRDFALRIDRLQVKLCAGEFHERSCRKRRATRPA